MQKLFTFVVVSLFSSLSFAASTDVSTESITRGNTTQTRALTGSGVLTESTCVKSTQGSDTLSHCVSQQTRLSAKQTAAMQASFASISGGMQAESEQASIQRQFSDSASKTQSSTSSISQSRRVGSGLDVALASTMAHSVSESVSSSKSSISDGISSSKSYK